MKIMAFLRGSGEPAAFHEGLLARADAIAAALPGGAVLNLVDPTPPDIPYRPANDTGLGAARPPYDAVIDAWGPDAAGLDDTVRSLMAGVASACHVYGVEETVILDRAPGPGKPSGGIKLIGQLMFHADMPDSAVKRSWAQHAPLAVRVHVGAGRYVQNFVTHTFGEGAPPTRGIPQMHFPTRADLIERFVDSYRGMQEILQDTAHFVAGGPRLYAREWVLRPPAW